MPAPLALPTRRPIDALATLYLVVRAFRDGIGSGGDCTPEWEVALDQWSRAPEGTACVLRLDVVAGTCVDVTADAVAAAGAEDAA